MTHDTIETGKSPLADLPVSRRSLTLLGALAALWSVLSWFVVDWQVQERTAALVARHTSEAERSAATLGANMDRVLNRLEGLAAVVAAGSDVTTALASFGPGVEPSELPNDTRKAAWTDRPDLLALNRKLLAANEDVGVDAIWVMNASGDCVAASNFATPMSFIGTNYADRDYFSTARAGKRGHQYAMGRVTKVPGLFFSAPVVTDGRFLGTVAIKNDLSRIAPAINHPYGFVADDQGVIILAADRSLEMRAVPGAAVHQLPSRQKLARYMRETFEPIEIHSGGRGGLVRVAGLPHPHIAARSELPQHGITAHILAPVKEIEDIRGNSYLAFLLLWASGIMLFGLAFGARLYVLRARQHRQSMETKNEALSKLNEHLDRLARLDPLTGCANRRHFQACLERELGRAARYDRECSVLSIDIDYFKQINDLHGHAGGDEALRHFVQITRQQLRTQDELGRLGGEEFAIVLPETGLTHAMAVAERIRCAIEATPARFEDKPIPLTASIGVARWKAPGEAMDALLQRADTALYAAKTGGRNRVEACGKAFAEPVSRTGTAHAHA